MARVPITDQIYDALVQGFRESPGNLEHARRRARCGRDMAKRAWERGWPHFRNGKSIQDLFLDEQQAARSALIQEQAAKLAAAEREREDARRQAIEARKQEGQIVQLARGTSVQALVLVGQIVTGARALAGTLKKQLEAEAAKPAADMSPKEIVYLLGRVAEITARLNNAAELAMKMERLHLGEPTSLIGITTAGGSVADELTLDEAELQIEAAQQALRDAKRAVGGTAAVAPGQTSGQASLRLVSDVSPVPRV